MPMNYVAFDSKQGVCVSRFRQTRARAPVAGAAVRVRVRRLRAGRGDCGARARGDQGIPQKGGAADLPDREEAAVVTYVC